MRINRYEVAAIFVLFVSSSYPIDDTLRIKYDMDNKKLITIK